MYAPVRAGTRGGQGDFKWSDVKQDNDREYYLGHSLMAAKGRWQEGRDLTWYNKDKGAEEDARAAEIRKIKEAEEDALAEALGYAPRNPNLEPIDPNKAVLDKAAKEREKEQHRLDKEQRRKERAAKREQREKGRAEGNSSSRHRHRDDRDDDHHRRSRREGSSRDHHDRDHRDHRDHRDGERVLDRPKGRRDERNGRSPSGQPTGRSGRDGRHELGEPARTDRDLPPHVREQGSGAAREEAGGDRKYRDTRDSHDRDRYVRRPDERRRDDRAPGRERSRSPRR